MQAPDDPIPAQGIDPIPPRRIALCAVTSLWLAGHWFFPEGFSHLCLFWCLVAPLALWNARSLPQLRRPQPWFVLLLALLLWQALVSSRHPGAWLQPGGWIDAIAVVIFLLALQAMAATRGAWTGLRWALFGVASATIAWSLLSFYPRSDVTLTADRFRNLLVYEEGLHPVLTGLLTGFAMLTGMTLATCGGSRARRVTLWAGIAVLAFAMMATLSRGAVLAATTGTCVLVWRERRRAIPAIASAGLGILAYLAAFSFTVHDTAPDPVTPPAPVVVPDPLATPAPPTPPPPPVAPDPVVSDPVAVSDHLAVPNLVSRGSAGRFSVYETHLDRLDGLDWWIGEGRAEALPEDLFGWYVDHPHSSLLTQLVHTGIPGLLLLAAFAALSIRSGIRKGHAGTAALALLVFGLTGLTFDGSQIASLFTVPRIESLLVLVPAVFAAAPTPGSGIADPPKVLLDKPEPAP